MGHRRGTPNILSLKAFENTWMHEPLHLAVSRINRKRKSNEPHFHLPYLKWHLQSLKNGCFTIIWSENVKCRFAKEDNDTIIAYLLR